MKLTNEVCYSALKAHDNRFDGVFFTGVKSTDVYCRPICPSRVPMQKNCAFYESPAAAELAGFRPCLRCRPELAPRMSGFAGDDSPAKKLATHIDETLMIDESFADVAEHFGLSDRHLRRIFVTEFGLEPRQYLTTQRLLFAKQLLSDTTMSVAQIAFASGFGSPGRLTVQMRAAYGITPAELKRQSKTPSASKTIVLHAGYRPPLAWQELLAFLAGRATSNEWTDNMGYHRLVEGYEVLVADNEGKNRLEVHIPTELAAKSHAILSRVRKMFDLSANPMVIADALSADPILAAIVARFPGLRVPGCWDDFEMLLRIIVGQQISVAGATTVMRRLVDNIGSTAAEIAASSPEQIVKMGMPFKRATTIWTIGDLVNSGKLNLNEHDPAKFYESLVAIPGIGPWTAEYLGMRVQRWPDAFPSGDLALQKAINPGLRATEKELTKIAEAWRPWRSYAALLLWRSLDNNGG